MQTTVKLNNTTSPLWNQLKDLSYEDKLAVFAKLSQSIVELEQRKFEDDWKHAVGVEEFRALCHKRVRELYGGR